MKLRKLRKRRRFRRPYMSLSEIVARTMAQYPGKIEAALLRDNVFFKRFTIPL